MGTRGRRWRKVVRRGCRLEKGSGVEKEGLRGREGVGERRARWGQAKSDRVHRWRERLGRTKMILDGEKVYEIDADAEEAKEGSDEERKREKG